MIWIQDILRQENPLKEIKIIIVKVYLKDLNLLNQAIKIQVRK